MPGDGLGTGPWVKVAGAPSLGPWVGAGRHHLSPGQVPAYGRQGTWGSD